MPSRGKPRLIVGLVVGLALLPFVASAQITTATVNGTVKDSQGGVIPGATVTLISDTRGVQVAEVTTEATGIYVIPNVTPDTYTVQVTLQGFKTLKTTGIIVSPGDRLSLPAFVLEVGTLSETVQVTGETPLVQASSGERSFSVSTTSVQNLPISNRNFRELAMLTPGVVAGYNGGAERIGGGGNTNIQMDGISAMDTGNNGQMLSMNVDAVAEVKVLVNSYQAEYGRSSGVQILSVTKSGSNQFRGSVYDIERHSRWNKNSWANIQNGVKITKMDQRDFGYAIGGPVGKPGGNNKLFFFYSHEYRPRTGGDVYYQFRVPTALERQGDFSQSRDNLGNLYPYVKDWTKGLPCSASNTAGCFQDGGVLGKIPASRLYGPGVNLLNMYPVLPNVEQGAGMNYNYDQRTPKLNTLSYQPAVRVDYQIASPLRVSFRFNGENRNSGLRKQYSGYALEGLTNSRGNQMPWITTMSASANYNIGSHTFIEAIWGRTQNFYASVLTGELTNRYTAGLEGVPDIYSTNRDINPDYWMYGALSDIEAPFFLNGRIELPQSVSWGTRSGNTPGTATYPGFVNVNRTWDLAGSVTHVRGRHTIKGGVGLNHSFKAQNMTQGAPPMGTLSYAENDNNPYNTGYGYANAITGVFDSYYQASKFIESGIQYIGIEPYIQDNWKVNNRLTLDYGLRFVHLQPEHDKYMQASNFFPDQWNAADQPALYTAGCPGGVYPCPLTRQAKNPLTGQLMGPGTTGLIGLRVPGTGDLTNGIRQQGQGISKNNFELPFLELAPRVGVAYLLRPDGKLIARGGFGIFYDRTEGNFTMSQSGNPPTAESTTLYYSQLQTLGQGAASGSVPTLVIYRYENDHLPTATTWNAGVQAELPYSFALDVSYVGQNMSHAHATQGSSITTDLNMVDLGTAYLPQYQDPTLSSTTPGGAAYTPNLLRAYQGYGNIRQYAAVFHRLSHSLQFSLQRRFNRGFSAGLNWSVVLMDEGTHSPDYAVQQRIEHRADGSVGLRADQKEYNEMMKTQATPTHLFKGNVVWDLPDLHASSSAMKVVGYILNDWQLSGIWTAQTGGGYSIGYSYQSNGGNVNLTGSPDYTPRIVIVGDTGSGCSNNQWAQFNVNAFAGPTYNSNAMESGRNYMRGCFQSIWDLALARNVRLGGTRNFQLRVEVYNVLNSSTYTSRQTTVQYNNPISQTVVNNQYNADGTLNESRRKPNQAGFGAVTGTTGPTTMQVQFRFSF